VDKAVVSRVDSNMGDTIAIGMEKYKISRLWLCHRRQTGKLPGRRMWQLDPKLAKNKQHKP